MENSLVLIP